jgi:hypothetical protein
MCPRRSASILADSPLSSIKVDRLAEAVGVRTGHSEVVADVHNAGVLCQLGGRVRLLPQRARIVTSFGVQPRFETASTDT